MVCGTGVGASIAANKAKGIGARIVGAWLTNDLVKAWLEAEFSTDEDFRRRVAKLYAMESGLADGTI
ncbi:hypothetical protein HCU01_30860 [Halomonas cupida]|uniref:Ribose 5-phosphate isomerase B n=1 Tax=Halomonas cupida TaxID=44933 RepID=A0A1M7CAB1_9GAMM|nr:hypothetical protein [Halomonas cupida]GEN25137.1 hypothetical protein HCU01_30860 [Halomonas cupida]SHL64185.1 ribose 5-phosphate isomerase B [Halomonas cupida]